MKIVLQKDVKDLGKAGDLVSVAGGFARNFLFPKKLAIEATEKRVKEFEHIKKVAEYKRKRAEEERKTLAEKLEGLTISFRSAAGDSDKLFGSITTKDISDELEKQGFSVDKKDISLAEPIRMLGQHKAKVNLGEHAEAELIISVDRED